MELENTKSKVADVLKRIILVIALFMFIMILYGNLNYYVHIKNDYSEEVTSKLLTSKQYIEIGITIGIIFVISLLEVKSEKIKKILLFVFLSISLIFQTMLAIHSGPNIRTDQLSIYDSALEIKNNNQLSAGNRYYLTMHKHQIPLVIIYSKIFKIFNGSEKIYWIYNIIFNLLSIFMISKIADILSKKHKINWLIIFLTMIFFIPLQILVTFFYGDIPALTMTLIGTYYVLKYTEYNESEKRNSKYMIFAAIAMMFAIIFRKNSMIIVIAQFMYLLFNSLDNIAKKKKESEITSEKTILVSQREEDEFNETLEKENKNYIFKLLSLIFIFIIIVYLPPKVLTNNMVKKYNLNERKPYPTVGYIYMGMMPSERANGWYSGLAGEPGRKDPNGAVDYYKRGIEKRLKEFLHNPKLIKEFYITKSVSMWSENTYGSTWNYLNLDNEKNIKNKEIIKYEEIISLTQKAILIFISIRAIIIIFSSLKSKYISNEIILLILIALGGYTFHMLWEAKSRYIIPYLVLMFPFIGIYGIKDKEKYTNTNICE